MRPAIRVRLVDTAMFVILKFTVDVIGNKTIVSNALLHIIFIVYSSIKVMNGTPLFNDAGMVGIKWNETSYVVPEMINSGASVSGFKDAIILYNHV